MYTILPKLPSKVCVETFFKGTVALDFLMSFFHQTVPSGPKILCLRLLFSFFFFRGVIEVLKLFPSVQDTSELQIASVLGAGVSWALQV